jgi:hypothetical protein
VNKTAGSGFSLSCSLSDRGDLLCHVKAKTSDSAINRKNKALTFPSFAGPFGISFERNPYGLSSWLQNQGFWSERGLLHDIRLRWQQIIRVGSWFGVHTRSVGHHYEGNAWLGRRVPHTVFPPRWIQDAVESIVVRLLGGISGGKKGQTGKDQQCVCFHRLYFFV